MLFHKIIYIYTHIHSNRKRLTLPRVAKAETELLYTTFFQPIFKFEQNSPQATAAVVTFPCLALS